MGFLRYFHTFSYLFELNIYNQAFQKNKLKRKNISLSGARTHKSTVLEQYIFRAEIEKYFVRFLVQVKTVELAFEIN